MTDDEIILGIDLGTTFSVAAYVDPFGIPTVIPNAEGEKTTPSAVLVEDGDILVGLAAADQAIAKKGRVIQWIKRSMGEDNYTIENMTPVQVSAEILKKIKADCEAYFAARNQAVNLSKAVITCPAYFTATEVENTKRAGELAEFDVQEIVREPTAAAVYYGVEHLKEGGKLLVCDLGGGTFDASILTLENGVFRSMATAGDRQLGGHDWTKQLLSYVAEQFSDRFGDDPLLDPTLEQYLYDCCEKLKRSFAHVDQGAVTCTYQGRTETVTVSRQVFERITEYLISQVVEWSEKSLVKALPPLTWAEVDEILLVGGSTRLRRVAEALAQRSGKKPVQTAEADTMVALGAAILGRGAYRPRRPSASSGIKKDVRSGLTRINIQRTAARNFGTRVITRTPQGSSIQNSILIPYGADIPTQKTREDYRIGAAGQRFFDIPVVEFDDIGPDAIQKTFRFHCPPEISKGAAIHVTFIYDKNGQIDVEALDPKTGSSLTKERIDYQEPESVDGAAAGLKIVFALDVSGSMDEYHKIDRARQAVLDNAGRLLSKGANQIEIGVVAFGSQAQTICALTASYDVLEKAVARLVTYGTTAMHSGLELAYNLLKDASKDTRRMILLVSDGQPDNPAMAVEIGHSIRSQGIDLKLIHIGGEGINQSFLSDISPDVFSVDNLDRLEGTIQTLLTLDAPQAQSGITWLQGGSRDGNH